MSKESYARGFCKAAAAAGVDPKVLFKFAQEFKTNGWAPQVVTSIGKNRAPSYSYDDEGTGRGGSIQLIEKAEPIEAANEVQNALDLANEIYDGENRIVAVNPRAAIDPRYAAWLNAHKKALGNISEKISPFFHSTSKDVQFSRRTPNPSLADSIARAYHDSMAKSTGAVSRVSAPVKK